MSSLMSWRTTTLFIHLLGERKFFSSLSSGVALTFFPCFLRPTRLPQCFILYISSHSHFPTSGSTFIFGRFKLSPGLYEIISPFRMNTQVDRLLRDAPTKRRKRKHLKQQALNVPDNWLEVIFSILFFGCSHLSINGQSLFSFSLTAKVFGNITFWFRLTSDVKNCRF